MARRKQSLDLSARLYEILEDSTAVETTTSNWLRDFLIHEAGWPAGILQAQRRGPAGAIDYSAELSAGTRVHIEVKRPGVVLKESMISKYLDRDSSSADVLFGVLTNLREVHCYLSGRRVARLGIPVLTLAPETLDHRLDRHESLWLFRGIESRFWERAWASTLAAELVVKSTRATQAYNKAYRRRFTGRVVPASQALDWPNGAYRNSPDVAAGRMCLFDHTVLRIVFSEMKALLPTRLQPRDIDEVRGHLVDTVDPRWWFGRLRE